MLVTVGRYSFPYEAHLHKGLLEAAYIPAFIADEHTISMDWLYSNALGGVRLQVPAAYAEQARAVLAEVEEQHCAAPAAVADVDADEPEYPACPRCGSQATSYYRVGRRAAFLAFLWLNFPLFPTRDGYRCNSCGHVTAR
ncbi:DUF2007 domain-containing protein [Pseudomaricurvus sp. HS19]|uniref:putative signal transducing protein n=1 Tax=Pseudomaricurvus sp. HS19 TaxID=2692626 RepID=UPI00136BA36B|nr:DUF2007 domain-containing protein [Pseudomaricurvus sp. HS19]MYM63038.1 DUF2007 domain-containing protein [Pseudomaricurvus sp. HS19]